MKFPNAAKGVSKIFTAEILSLIALVAVGIMSIFSAFVVATSQGNSDLSTGFVASAAGFVVFGAVAGILGIIALILNIVGVVQTAKDEDSFRVIIYLTVLSLIVAFAAAVFSGNQFASNLSKTVSDLVSLICSVLVVLGIINMAAQYNNIEIIEKGGKIFKIIIIVGLLSLIMRCISIIIPNQNGAVIILILAIISLILGIVQYCIYLSFLSKAKKMLNEE